MRYWARFFQTSLLFAAAAGCTAREDPAAPTPTPGNAAPVFTSATSASVAENSGGAVYTAAATDADGDTITFALSGGADQALFSISGADVAFQTPPDFEAPADADGDNIYELIVSASDGTDTAIRNVSITVTDVAEAFSLRRIATSFTQPLFVAGRGDGSNRIFVVEKPGQIETLDLDTGLIAPTPFLDITASVSDAGEGGLLGLALAPDFATSGIFFVYVTNLSGDTEVRRYQTSASDPDQADLSSMDVILTFAQPFNNHNAGWIGFDSDGFLYIASGDGGGSGDPQGNGQDTSNLLGAILRIDVRGDDFPTDPSRDYLIPADNPFATSGGAPEIWAYGLRNPFRASFDRLTGDLYIGDVGQDAVEEIDLIQPGEAGLNFGWNIFEGTEPFAGGPVAGLTPPVAEYRHGSGPRQGNSVAGGYVYRGPVTALQGQYVFGDFVTNNIWSIPAASISQGTTIDANSFILQNSNFTPDSGTINGITSFGEDDAANLYVADISGQIFVVEP